MGETTKYKLPWPEMNSSSDGPGAFRNLAEKTETAFNTVTVPPIGMMRHRVADFNVLGDSKTVPFTLDYTTYATGSWTLGSYGHIILPKTGRYILSMSVVYSNVANAVGSRFAGIYLDGAPLAGAGVISPYNSGHSVALNVTVVRSIGTKRLVGLWGWQNSGKTIVCTEAHLSVNWVGA